MILLLQVACGSPTSSVPINASSQRLDQQTYYEQLLERRPELMTQHGNSVRDPAWQALVIRPRYREEVLASSSTYATILEREYTFEFRQLDEAWAAMLRAGQKSYTPTPTLFPAGYPIDVYVGYHVGTRAAPRDADGYSFKAFLELDDFNSSLTPERYLAFSQTLELAGFRGDSKVDLRPGQVRFQYNNVIIHAPSAQMAQCAEEVGRRFFAGEVIHVARGVDAPPSPGETATDWHHFLLRGGFSRLPRPVQDFVRYLTPDAPCPIR